MDYHLYVPALIALSILSLIGFLLLGRIIGRYHYKNFPDDSGKGITQIENTILALLGLMIAFTFYSASQRFDFRRSMIVNEANAIGTAWLRIDLLPGERQPPMKTAFKEYMDARTNAITLLPDAEASQKQIQRSQNLESVIWQQAIDSLPQAQNPVINIALIQALNTMFDTCAAHNISLVTHLPAVVYITLFFLLCCSCLFLGYSLAEGKKSNWIHGIGYILIMVTVMYVIIDFEFPRAGFLSMENYDRPMLELKEKMFAN